MNVLTDTESSGPGNSSACTCIVPLLLKFVPECNIVFSFVESFCKKIVYDRYCDRTFSKSFSDIVTVKCPFLVVAVSMIVPSLSTINLLFSSNNLNLGN